MIQELPTLRTERLLLRPFSALDAARVQALAGAREVYATTLTVPHPYENGIAERWIATHGAQFAAGKAVTLAITRRDDGMVVGAMSLDVRAEHRRAELGYWIGVPYWNNGYCTEAAAAIVQYAFEVLDLHKITSRYLVGNGASERVMIKIGMRKEGELVDEILKDGVFRTAGVYGLVRP